MTPDPFKAALTITEDSVKTAAAHIKHAAALAAQVPGIPADTPLRPIRKVVVIGAGTMGGGIAMSLANIGIACTVTDASAEGLERGLQKVRENYQNSVARGRLDQAAMDQRVAMIVGALDLAAVKEADLVIEAVFEDLQLKKDIFKVLDTLAKPGAILATNTSGLDVNAIGAATKRPQDVVGAHFFSPAHVMKLLEVIRSDATAPDVIATLMDLGRRMGKTAVLARVYPGFIGNALFRNYTREAHFVVEDGAMPHEVDGALTKFGYAMGVLAVQDLAGNDVGYQTRKAAMATRDPSRRWNDLTMKLTDMGRRGQKDGKGWYLYAPGDRKPLRDPEFEQWLVQESARMGITRRSYSEVEILKRCLYGMVNEGARLLELGIAMRPSDIDTVFLTGYGFPAQHGGPMFLADKIGLANVLADIQRFHQEHGVWWTPAPLLQQLVKEGKSFADYQTHSAKA
jgi:3-hydroxyacyl-CoA dehydrogenase